MISAFSLLQVKDVEACQGKGDEPHFTVINFKNGSVLYKLNTVETLRDKIRQGVQVRSHLLNRPSCPPAAYFVRRQEDNL